ncbi:helix-turn-helix transcriptional regulator [Humibacillus xanthopallidus]|uniref:helix-turn-helix transcriptional regulator n=1 Tax=Humibacillus xanthopallidus TaxID=412689 RepID=UPI00163A7230|nr:helix-turn-helix transcriptional regulator [Humibacillus xanthopallidus]
MNWLDLVLGLGATRDRQRYHRDINAWWGRHDALLTAATGLSAYLVHELHVANEARDGDWTDDVLRRAVDLHPGTGDVAVLHAMRAFANDDTDGAQRAVGSFLKTGAYPIAATTGYLLAALLADREGSHRDTGHWLREALRVVERRLSYRPLTFVPRHATALLRARIGTFGPLDDVAAQAIRALDLTPKKASVPLTTQERAVLELLVSQLTVPGIAMELAVSPNTIRTHLKSLYLKLDVHTRADAVARARLARLL